LGLNISARVCVVIFQFINIGLYTNYLTAEQLGFYFFLLTVSYAANAVLFVPMDYYQQAHLLKRMKDEGGARSLLNLNGKMLRAYAIFVLCVLGFCLWLAEDEVMNALLVMLLALLLYIVQALRNTLNNLEYRNDVSVSFVQEAILKVGLFLLLLQCCDANETTLMVAWMVSLGLTALYLAFKTYRFHVFSNAKSTCIDVYEVLLFSYPFSIGAVCHWLQLQGYRLVLVPLGFAEEVGFFATLSNIGSAAIGAAALIYSQQFTPLIYKTKGLYTEQYLKGALLLTAAVFVVAFVLGEPVVSFLTSQMFVAFWPLILFGVVTDAGAMLIGALAIHVTLVFQTTQVIRSSFLGLLVMVVMLVSLLILKQISVMSIGLPLLISQWMVVVYMYWKFIKNA